MIDYLIIGLQGLAGTGSLEIAQHVSRFCAIITSQSSSRIAGDYGNPVI
jgi:hypothetical protein